MPFQQTLVPPAPDPDIHILFYGMLLLCPNGGGCFVGVHTKSSAHNLYLAVNVKGQPLPIAFVNGKLKEPFKITVTENIKGVSKYVGSDDRNFNAAIDLQKLHPGKHLQLDPAFTEPGIDLNEGVLYAGALTPSTTQVVTGQPGSPYSNHDPVAYPIAADISFAGRTVELTWEDNAGPHILTLPRPDTTNEKYVILINNGENPVMEPPVPKPGEVACGDFIDHYMVVSGVDDGERFNVCFTPKTEIKDHNVPVATRVPCMAIVVDG